MPHPFPGMNPYLEAPDMWRDLHTRMMACIADHLAPLVAPKYIVRVERRTYSVEGPGLDFIGSPDVAVPATRRTAGAGGSARKSAAAGALTVQLPVPDVIREAYLEVRDTATRAVVTSLELLSPTNKLPGEGRRLYEQKRSNVPGSLTNLVEIDLVRVGRPMTILGAPRLGDYRIIVSRGGQRARSALWAFGVRDPIPRFVVPLQRGDREPELDLGKLIQNLHDRARYDLEVDYSMDAVPPLRGADRSWANQLLRRVGLR